MLISNTKDFGLDRLKIGIFGPSGSGKTTLAKTTEGPTLVISAEAGLLCLRGADMDVVDIARDDAGNILPKEKRIVRLVEVYKYLLTEEAKEKYKWVFLDSLTELSQNLIDELNLEFPDRKNALVMYGENAKRMRSIIKSFRDLPWYHVVMTMLSEIDKDENNQRFVAPSVIGKISSQLPAFFDEFFYLHSERNNDGVIERRLVTGGTEKMPCKDRSGKLNQFEPPHLGEIARKILT